MWRSVPLKRGEIARGVDAKERHLSSDALRSHPSSSLTRMPPLNSGLLLTRVFEHQAYNGQEGLEAGASHSQVTGARLLFIEFSQSCCRLEGTCAALRRIHKCEVSGGHRPSPLNSLRYRSEGRDFWSCPSALTVSSRPSNWFGRGSSGRRQVTVSVSESRTAQEHRNSCRIYLKQVRLTSVLELVVKYSAFEASDSP
jgi:hypothetical protein